MFSKILKKIHTQEEETEQELSALEQLVEQMSNQGVTAEAAKRAHEAVIDIGQNIMEEADELYKAGELSELIGRDVQELISDEKELQKVLKEQLNFTGEADRLMKSAGASSPENEEEKLGQEEKNDAEELENDEEETEKIVREFGSEVEEGEAEAEELNNEAEELETLAGEIEDMEENTPENDRETMEEAAEAAETAEEEAITARDEFDTAANEASNAKDAAP